jgi:antitoxin (DNA-binding transcriptional repressor) of toxin-antitoxin stability system
MRRYQTEERKLYNYDMPENVVHISESEAASDFALVMTRVREGAEVIIERDAKPVAVVRLVEAVRGRPISESIALAEAHAKELGYEPTMDPDFAADLEEIIKSRKPRNISTWE